MLDLLYFNGKSLANLVQASFYKLYNGNFKKYGELFTVLDMQGKNLSKFSSFMW